MSKAGARTIKSIATQGIEYLEGKVSTVIVSVLD